MATPEKPLTKWTVNELKSELKNRGLSQTGLKAELMERLQQAMTGDGTAGAGSDAGNEAEQEGGDSAVASNGVTATEPEQDTAEADKAEDGNDDVAEADAMQTDVPESDQPAEAADVAEPVEPAAAKEEPAAEAPAGDAKAADPPPPVPEVDYGPEEWQIVDVPEHWQTLPLIKVSQIPEGSTIEEVTEVLSKAGVHAKSVAFEEPARGGKISAYVRLSLTQPVIKPKAPDSTPKKDSVTAGKPAEIKAATENGEEKAKDENAPEVDEEKKEEEEKEEEEKEEEEKEEEKKDEEKKEEEEEKQPEEEPELVTTVVTKPEDLDGVARAAVQKLKASKVQLKQNILYSDVSVVYTTLFVANLPFDTDEELQQAFEEYGAVQRGFIVRNPEGESKGYGFVEFSLPLCAEKARESIDKKFREAQTARSKSTKPEAPKTEAKPAVEKTPSKEVVKEQAEPTSDTKEDAEPAEKPVDGATENGKVEAEAEAPKAESESKDEPKEQPADQEMKEAEQVVGEEKPAEGTAAKEEATTKPSKVVKADFSSPKTVAQLFSGTLYVSNLPQGYSNHEELKSIFAEYGPVVGCNFAKNQYGHSKGFGFVEFKRSDHADKALRALDGTEHSKLGSISVSFSNPAKISASRPMRPSFAGPRPSRGPSYPATYGRQSGSRTTQFYGGRGAPAGRGYAPAGRFNSGYPGGRGTPFPARGAIPARGSVSTGFSGRGIAPAAAYNAQAQQAALIARQQAVQMQQMARQAQVQAAAYQRQALQQQQQLAQLQARVQQAEQERLRAVQEAATLKQRQEAERKAAQATAKQQAAQTYQSGYGSGSYANQSNYNQSNYSSYAAQPSSTSTYGTGAGQSTSSQQQAAYGGSGYSQQAAYGSSGYGTQSQAPTYSSSQSGYGSQSGYSSQPASGYNQSGYGTGSASAYGQSGYGQSGYGQQQQSGSGYAAAAGQKREAEYDYSQGGYNSTSYGSSGYGQDYKRGRY